MMYLITKSLKTHKASALLFLFNQRHSRQVLSCLLESPVLSKNYVTLFHFLREFACVYVIWLNVTVDILFNYALVVYIRSAYKICIFNTKARRVALDKILIKFDQILDQKNNYILIRLQFRLFVLFFFCNLLLIKFSFYKLLLLQIDPVLVLAEKSGLCIIRFENALLIDFF